MSTDEDRPWDQALDEALVERLISAIQHATTTTIAGPAEPEADLAMPAPELATALLNLLATVVEPAPRCCTRTGMRKVSEAAGRELLVLMRGVRDLKTRCAEVSPS